jgi:hypothetical protein
MKWKVTLAAVTLFVVGSLFYATPHFTLWRMKTAAEAGDYETFSRFVDYPKLRESARQSLIESGVIDRALERGTGNRALDLIAGALASPVMNAAIDAAISPQSLALLMQGKSWAEARSGRRARSEVNSTSATSEPPKVEIEMGYESMNEFSLRVKKRDSTSEPSQFMLTRSSLLSWKLSSIKLPLR